MTSPTLTFCPSLTLISRTTPLTDGRNFDHGFVGFEFHDGLAFGNGRAGRDQQAHQIAGVDVLAEFGEFELAWRQRQQRRSGCGGRLRGAGGLRAMAVDADFGSGGAASGCVAAAAVFYRR